MTISKLVYEARIDVRKNKLLRVGDRARKLLDFIKQLQITDRLLQQILLTKKSAKQSNQLCKLKLIKFANNKTKSYELMEANKYWL